MMDTSCIIFDRFLPPGSKRAGKDEAKKKKKKKYRGGVEGKAAERDEERSAADRFCFSQRVKEVTGCKRESHMRQAPPPREEEGQER